jgi:hypothetical protein
MHIQVINKLDGILSVFKCLYGFLVLFLCVCVCVCVCVSRPQMCHQCNRATVMVYYDHLQNETHSSELTQWERGQKEISNRWHSVSTLRITGFLDIVHCPEFQTLGHIMFQKLDLFPSIQLGPSERANLNHWTTHVIYHLLDKHLTTVT